MTGDRPLFTRICRKGHAIGEDNIGLDGRCRICAREYERVKRRAAGIPERSHIPTCRCGHDLTIPENLRPGRKDCAICHRESQKRRYHADRERHVAASTAYQRKNRDAVNERIRRWRAENRDREAYRRYGTANLPLVLQLRRDPCAYCGGPGGEIDHIVPVMAGGDADPDNLTGACRSCNASKNRTPLLIWLAQRA